MTLIGLALWNASSLSRSIRARLGRILDDRSARVRVVWVDVEQEFPIPEDV